MAAREPTYWDYVKSAFFARKQVRGLGGVPVNVLALLGCAVAGFVNPGFWLIGAGLEVAYLAWLSQNRRFRNLVRGERLLESVSDHRERIRAVVARLSPASQERYGRLEEKCAVIRDLGSLSARESLDSLSEMKESGLNSLLMLHAKLLFSRETVQTYMREESIGELEAKVADTETRLARSSSAAVKRSLEGNLEILKKRIEHHRNASENLHVIDAELDRIENQVELIRAEAAVSRDPTVLSARIDAVASTIGEASEFLRANQMLLGDFAADDAPLPLPGQGKRTAQ